MKFRTVTQTIALCLVAMTATAGFATPDGAREVVKDTADQVIERLKAEKVVLDANPDKIYGIINELVIPHFDFFSMSRWVLGRAWNQASKQQQQEFVNQFRTLLVRTYARALLEYSDNPIRYYPVQSQPDSSLVVVRTEVADPGGGNPIPLNYRMHNAHGAWKVVDVTVDGVSLVSTYRGSFASEIRKSGLDGLIARLMERNERIGVTAGSN